MSKLYNTYKILKGTGKKIKGIKEKDPNVRKGIAKGLKEHRKSESYKIYKSTMKKLLLILSLLAFTSCVAVGPKCTYTQEGTRIESWLWLFKGEKPVDVDKMNCN